MKKEMTYHILSTLFGIAILAMSIVSVSAATSKSNIKKVIKYKTYSSVDLSGTMISGKIRTPEIFYIFQRKRSMTGTLLKIPPTLGHHQALTRELSKGVILP